jgi:methylglutaconyl-CoA hydratase
MPPTRYDVAGSVATVTLDLPDKRNALTAELLDSLGEGLSAARDDDRVRVVVLTHTGTTFCAGADLSSGASAARNFDLAAVLRLIEEVDKPVVARIGGACRGGGVGLAAACDLSVASTEASFAFSEVRLGVAPAIISVVCLAKLDRADASELFLTGERFDAARAVAVGLINRVVAPERLDETVTSLVDQLLLGAPGALGAAKRLLTAVPAMDRTDAYEWTTALSEELFASDEAAEGMAAFRERRPPPWAGGGSGQTG